MNWKNYLMESGNQVEENKLGEGSVKKRKCKNSTAAQLLFNSHGFDLLVNKAVRVSVVNVLGKPTKYQE